MDTITDIKVKMADLFMSRERALAVRENLDRQIGNLNSQLNALAQGLDEAQKQQESPSDPPPADPK